MNQSPTAALLLVMATLGCGDSASMREAPDLWAEEDLLGTRTFATVSWDSQWMVGGPGDTTLFSDGPMAAGPDGVYVYDRGSQRVVAVSTGGDVRWTFGRQGSGPDEFRNVRDIKIDADGVAWVLDVENQRLTGLSSAGAVVARVPLRDVGRSEQVAPLADGTFLTVSLAPEEPVIRFDRTGAVVDRSEMVWGRFGGLPAIARQGLLVSAGQRAAYLFAIGNGWFPFEGAPSGRVEPYVVDYPFPAVLQVVSGDTRRTRIAERPACSACSAALVGDTLLVLAGGRGEERLTIVDRYRFSTGDYIDSVRLPVRPGRLAINGTRYYFLLTDPYPELWAVELTMPGS